MSKAVADTDILSAFGKVGQSKVLDSLFEEILITPAVFDELLKAKGAGFVFVDEILKMVKISPLTSEIAEKVKQFSNVYPYLGRGARSLSK